MPSREAWQPVPMRRVAVVVPLDQLRPVLVAVADAGVVQLEPLADSETGPAGEALGRLRHRLGGPSVPADQAPADRPGAVLMPEPPDPAALERYGRAAELEGEAELERISRGACRRAEVAALAGWAPEPATTSLADQVARLGGALVHLRPPPDPQPPTLVTRRGLTGAFEPLVDTYATPPYADLNIASLAGIAYSVMFGMMFGDVGHGALLLVAGLVLTRAGGGRLARVRQFAPFVIGAAVASIGFGLLYGDFFGPTHVFAAIWLTPVDQPTTLIVAAVAAGGGLLAVAYAIGAINRWREGGPVRALVATAGGAGLTCYLGVAVTGLGLWRHWPAAVIGGAVATAAGCGLVLVGAAGAGAGVAQGAVEVYEMVLGIGTNTLSFARLAAFGLTHAALGQVIWQGSTALWARGPLAASFGALVFVAGNAVAFALEGLVAGVQAMRLEYYELFSRVFVSEGRPFRPWHVPTGPSEPSPRPGPTSPAAPDTMKEEAPC